MATEKKTKEQIIAAFQAALAAGNQAGNARIRELAKQPVQQGKMLEECGTSRLHLYVDGRTSIGKILAELRDPSFSVLKTRSDGFLVRLRYDLKIVPPVSGQEFSIGHDSNEAAAKVLEQQLGIPVSARLNID